MSGDDSDDSQKTEEPTTKRLEDARKKGQVSVSKEISNLMCLIAIYILLSFYVDNMLAGIMNNIMFFPINSKDFDIGSISTIWFKTFTGVIIYMILPFALFILFGLMSGVVQNGFMITWEAIAPKWNRVSLPSGLKRMFSSKSIVELLKGLLKISIVGYVGYIGMKDRLGEVVLLYSYDLADAMNLLKDLLISFIMGVISAMIVIAMADILYQRYSFRKSLMMTKQEIKDELKNTDGNPEVKSKLRKLRNDLIGNNMQKSVPEADVIITNPTHYAVGLKYDVATMMAPKVIVKGRDEIAQKIKEIAYNEGVIMVENKLLAQNLYYEVSVDEYVPEEYYRSVADVINYVWSLKGKK